MADRKIVVIKSTDTTKIYVVKSGGRINGETLIAQFCGGMVGRNLVEMTVKFLTDTMFVDEIEYIED